MNDLELCGAFAVIDGRSVEVRGNGCYGTETHGQLYNPISNLSLNCAARDKYEVTIIHYDVLDCGVDGNSSFDVPCVDISIDGVCYESIENVTATDIPKAVINCIVKSRIKS